MRPVERLLATARAEIGYIEKDTNAQLDDKTANAGDGNWNKYARDLDALGVVYNGKKNGYAWCDIFTDWCFIQTFGLELGLKLLCQAIVGSNSRWPFTGRLLYPRRLHRLFAMDLRHGGASLDSPRRGMQFLSQYGEIRSHRRWNHI